MKVLITGASGLIGSQLYSAFSKKGYEVLALSRKSSADSRSIGWDYTRRYLETDKLDGLDLVVHLAGQNIAGKRWTNEYKKEIFDSRVMGTEFLFSQLKQIESPPKRIISASAIGYYGDRKDELLSEFNVSDNSFFGDLCQHWENAARNVFPHTIITRIGVVLSMKGGALKEMLLPFRLGLGSKLGTGDQYVSWIHESDLISAFLFLSEARGLKSSIFNLSTPNPVKQKEFASSLANTLRRPCFISMPKIALKVIFGEQAEALLLPSLRVIPKALIEEGFEFKFPNLDSALKNLILNSEC